ncbi:54S ribosomal protein L8, mitochondrial-like [Vigna radiata var. radiata]|uniref:54S ribosomal protein L8, mitochondrial-like n=1 Tax=Vigna radiata var. radiata TaxID=3916 RepID=A0A1S3UB83_VIGRR|nr:54S ribosomal protein L8, mitochondrial-like [Vigna radiata var. radiata]
MTKFRKLGRPTGHRMSMLRTMVSQLVKHERIETTVAKAKEIRRLADNMVQLGKENGDESIKGLVDAWNLEIRLSFDCSICQVRLSQFFLFASFPPQSGHMASWGLGEEFFIVNFEVNLSLYDDDTRKA